MSQDGTGSPTISLSKKTFSNRFMHQQYKLVVASGPLKGKEMIVSGDVFKLGSGAHNDLVLDDSTASRRHCEIRLMPGGYVIRDLGSTNGTLVQGVDVAEAVLSGGTEIQLGQTRIIFSPVQRQMEFTVSEQDHFGSLLGSSIVMRRVFHLAERYASTEATVLIEGETGTGKEVLAEEIHRHSSRKDRPFIVIDCASLAKELIASELFGHSKGAFTGANTDRIGAFEHADGGTVFLDEIGDLAEDLQPKLLRVLEKREIRRLGSNAVKPINVRMIAATNRRLENEVNAGRFREDLFFRLSVVHVELPSLRKRKGDLPVLIRKFLHDFMGDHAEDKVEDFDEAIEVFNNHDWPGNVRELRNLIEVACCSQHPPISLRSALQLSTMRMREEPVHEQFQVDRPFKDAKQNLVWRFEEEYIRELLVQHGGNVSRAARTAGIERAYLQRLLRKHGLRAGSDAAREVEDTPDVQE